MIMRKLYIAILAFIFCFGTQETNATHLVGGEFLYRFLGEDLAGNNRYEVTLYIYQDCLTGLPDVIAEDNPAYIGIFSRTGQVLLFDSISSNNAIPVPPNFSNECVNNPPATCLRRTRFVKTYVVPKSTSGYRIIYSRCCRNESITNINRPGEVGATYYCDIPPVNIASNNNSAVFKNYPPQIICINNPLAYDHSATDVDGDSLSYELCDAYPGGSRANSKPYPSSGILPSPISVFADIRNNPSYGYRPGYTAQRPMGGSPLIQIDSKTGLLTGTPNLMGRYVVSVCCHEWRGGIIINTVRREFQFVVTNCSKAVVADIPQLSNENNTYIVECKDKTVEFINKSIGGFAYAWDFGVSGATSSDFAPTYTYPDTGTYTVTLIVNKGSTCPDSISRLVKIYPTHTADFEVQGLLCPKTPISFVDRSEATYKPVTNWEWAFGDGATSQVQNPMHSFNVGGDYPVTLTSTTIKGCRDVITKNVKVEAFVPFAGNDTIIVKGERINFKASGGTIYKWTPANNLNVTNIPNPIGFYPDTGMFRYNVHISTPIGCEGDDSIRVWVVNQSSLFVPSAFSPNGDGLNDYLKLLSVGYAKVNFFRIYNRFGQAVFETNDISKGWDGRQNGKTADIGTYFWVISVTDRFGAEEMIKGDVTLVR
ncbi:hypothetical protein CAP35_08615 [Chitinophagaceae bacterium IBVUCB1]|nr:hypothetical protein CAP35_08615 [Chitinophagaceae bacterium IBVUCB1]